MYIFNKQLFTVAFICKNKYKNYLLLLFDTVDYHGQLDDTLYVSMREVTSLVSG